MTWMTECPPPVGASTTVGAASSNLTEMIYATGNARAIWLSFQNNHRQQWNQGVQEELLYRPHDPSCVCLCSFNLMFLSVCFAAQVSMGKPLGAIYGDWKTGFSPWQNMCKCRYKPNTASHLLMWNTDRRHQMLLKLLNSRKHEALWGRCLYTLSKQWKGSQSTYYNLGELWRGTIFN